MNTKTRNDNRLGWILIVLIGIVLVMALIATVQDVQGQSPDFSTCELLIRDTGSYSDGRTWVGYLYRCGYPGIFMGNYDGIPCQEVGFDECLIGYYDYRPYAPTPMESPYPGPDCTNGD